MLTTKSRDLIKEKRKLTKEVETLTEKYERNRQELSDKNAIDIKLKMEMNEIRKARDVYKQKSEEAIRKEMAAVI
jgi:hypothetical protein